MCPWKTVSRYNSFYEAIIELKAVYTSTFRGSGTCDHNPSLISTLVLLAEGDLRRDIRCSSSGTGGQWCRGAPKITQNLRGCHFFYVERLRCSIRARSPWRNTSKGELHNPIDEVRWRPNDCHLGGSTTLPYRRCLMMKYPLSLSRYPSPCAPLQPTPRPYSLYVCS